MYKFAGETREQILLLEKKLSQLKDEKHLLFLRLKKVLNEDDNRRRQLIKENRCEYFNNLFEIFCFRFISKQYVNISITYVKLLDFSEQMMMHSMPPQPMVHQQIFLPPVGASANARPIGQPHILGQPQQLLHKVRKISLIGMQSKIIIFHVNTQHTHIDQQN